MDKTSSFMLSNFLFTQSYDQIILKVSNDPYQTFAYKIVSRKDLFWLFVLYLHTGITEFRSPISSMATITMNKRGIHLTTFTDYCTTFCLIASYCIDHTLQYY